MRAKKKKERRNSGRIKKLEGDVFKTAPFLCVNGGIHEFEGQKPMLDMNAE